MQEREYIRYTPEKLIVTVYSMRDKDSADTIVISCIRFKLSKRLVLLLVTYETDLSTGSNAMYYRHFGSHSD